LIKSPLKVSRKNLKNKNLQEKEKSLYFKRQVRFLLFKQVERQLKKLKKLLLQISYLKNKPLQASLKN